MSYYDDKKYYNIKIEKDKFGDLKRIDKNKIIYSNDDRGYVSYGSLGNNYGRITSIIALNDLMLSISRDSNIDLLQLMTFCRDSIDRGESVDSVIRTLEGAYDYLHRTGNVIAKAKEDNNQDNTNDINEERLEREKKEKLEKEKAEREKLEKERAERERLEREKREQYKKQVIDSFMKDITSKSGNSSFRGWILPNGELISQYDDGIAGGIGRQDHGSLFRTFMNGLRKYDIDSFRRMNAKYGEYKRVCDVTGDIGESFATEVLGWMQVNVCGQKAILYQGERWQDRLIRPFLVDYGFNYMICPNKDRFGTIEFDNLYEHFGEILELGLQNKYNDSLERLALAM